MGLEKNGPMSSSELDDTWFTMCKTVQVQQLVCCTCKLINQHNAIKITTGRCHHDVSCLSNRIQTKRTVSSRYTEYSIENVKTDKMTDLMKMYA